MNKLDKLKWELELEKGWHPCGDPCGDGDEEHNLSTVIAFIKKNKANNIEIGYVEFVHQNKRLRACNLEVKKEFRRQGVATSMYEFAEKETGLKCTPHSEQTKDAKEFWNQKNKRFGT